MSNGSNYADEMYKNRLEEVKNLLFGQNIENYEEQIQQIQQNINQSQQVLLAKIEEVKNELLQALKETQTNMGERLKALEEAAQAELERQDKAHVSKQALSASLENISKTLLNN
ncbi:hypothetical protein [Eisenibacter elegans]|jgi:DNA-binding transcriptional ArsR family regulator|uniref:hypothetical protein n=1 Tax=Eisenibacter elegans TaxID=997 RepID=UPI00047DF2ED|nr:hypothetical protein [Eisenibacter elegans]